MICRETLCRVKGYVHVLGFVMDNRVITEPNATELQYTFQHSTVTEIVWWNHNFNFLRTSIFFFTESGKISVLNVTDMSEETNIKAEVNITIGGMDYKDENGFILRYKIRYKSLDWSDQWTEFSVEIPHTEEDMAYFEAIKYGGIINCSIIGEEPVASAKIISTTLELQYYTNYKFQAFTCGNYHCSEDLKETEVLTAAHAPSCAPPNIQMSDENPTKIKVTHGLLDNFCLHGLLDKYHFLLFDSEDYENLVARNASINETIGNATFTGTSTTDGKHFFRGVEEYWNYTLVAYATNTDVSGSGVLSLPLWHVTLEDGELTRP